MQLANRASKRERILRAAVRIFARHGFYVARVSQIARAAGVADGTIYLYFRSKDDILRSIFEDRIDALCALVEKETAGLADPALKLRKIVDLQLGTVRKHRDLAEVVSINLRQSNRFLKRFAAPKFNRYVDLIAGIVAEGQRLGVFRTDISPRVFACAMFGALDGLTLTWVIGRSAPERLERAASAAATMLIEGIRKRPAPTTRRQRKEGKREDPGTHQAGRRPGQRKQGEDLPGWQEGDVGRVGMEDQPVRRIRRGGRAAYHREQSQQYSTG